MKLRDTLELVTLGAIWGASFLFMKVSAPEFGPLALIELRVSIAAVFLLSLLWVRGGGGAELRMYWRQFLVLGAINSAVPFSLFAYATLSLPAGYSGVLNATVPLFAALLAFLWLGERMSRVRVIGLIIGFVGVVILVSGKLSLRLDLLSVAAGLLAALLYAVAALYTKRSFSNVSPLVVSVGGLVTAALWLIPLMPFSMPDRLPSAKSWLSALALGIGCTGIAYVLYFRLLGRIGPSRAITVTYLIPAFAILWGFMILGEPITLSTILGASVVLIGTTLVTRSR